MISVEAAGDVIAAHAHGHLHLTYVTVKDDPDVVPRNCQPVNVKISHSCCHVNTAMNTWLKWGRETVAGLQRVKINMSLLEAQREKKHVCGIRVTDEKGLGE